MLNSSPMMHSPRCQRIWVEFPSSCVLWLFWSPLGLVFQLCLGKWCPGLVCSWCMSGHSQSSSFYLEAFSTWSIYGERGWQLKLHHFLLILNLWLMILEKVCRLWLHIRAKCFLFEFKLVYNACFCRRSSAGVNLRCCCMVLWFRDGFVGCWCPFITLYFWCYCSIFEVICIIRFYIEMSVHSPPCEGSEINK